MDLLMIAFLALASVATGLFFMIRLVNWSTILRAHWLVDIVFTSLLFVLFQGTLQGTVIAVVAGLIMSLVLTAAKIISKAGQRIRALY